MKKLNNSFFIFPNTTQKYKNFTSGMPRVAQIILTFSGHVITNNINTVQYSHQHLCSGSSYVNNAIRRRAADNVNCSKGPTAETFISY